MPSAGRGALQCDVVSWSAARESSTRSEGGRRGQQFGADFCEDVAEELTLLRAHTESGGTLVASVLGPADSVEAFSCYWRAVRSVVPAAWPPDQYPHHRFANPQPLVATATKAGWESSSLAPVRGRRRIGASFAWEWLSGALPIGLGVAYRTLSDEVMAAVRAEFIRSWVGTQNSSQRRVDSRGAQRGGLVGGGNGVGATRDAAKYQSDECDADEERERRAVPAGKPTDEDASGVAFELQ